VRLKNKGLRSLLGLDIRCMWFSITSFLLVAVFIIPSYVETALQ
jgi:hypothetical protein